MVFTKGHEDLRKDKTRAKWHTDLLEIDQVKRWVENIARKSDLTAGVYRRGLGFYCDKMNTDPMKILEDAKEIIPLQNQFQDFISQMSSEGKKGAYLARYKKVIHSWTKFNNISNFRLNVNIENENINEHALVESVPKPEELEKVLRIAPLREKASISLMAFSGLRPQVLGNSKGTDCLKLGDIPDLQLNNGSIEFDQYPAQISVRFNLSKTKISWITFLAEEGCLYLKDYLEDRVNNGEELNYDSPVIYYDRNVKKSHECMPTFYVTRGIRETIRNAGFGWRPYIFRAYFATALDSAQSRGKITPEWRAKFMGHKGNIESTYNVNKKLSDDKINEMREGYKQCEDYFITKKKTSNQADYSKKLREMGISFVEMSLKIKIDEKERETIMAMPDEDFYKWIENQGKNSRADAFNNGNKQRVIRMKEVESFIENGWEYVNTLPNNKAIVKLPES